MSIDQSINQSSEHFMLINDGVASSSRSSPESEGDASIEAQTSHHATLQPHCYNSSPPPEFPAGLTGLHQPQPAAPHSHSLQNALLILIFLFLWERRPDGGGVYGRRPHAFV